MDADASEAALPRRGFVGLQVASAAITAPEGPGLYVRGIAKGSAAERAGARAMDRLVAIGGRTLGDIHDVRRLLRACSPGELLELGVLRDGLPIELRAEVHPYPTEQHAHGQICLEQVSANGHRLRAIALVPDAPGPHPVLYYLPGAHWASEEYPFAPEHPVPALLGELARVGIASLRVERSGMGDSEGPECNRVDFDAEYAGYVAGMRLLERAGWCDVTRVALLGHSIGAAIAPLLATAASTTLAPRAVITFGASAIPISAGLCTALRRYATFQPGVASDRVEKQCELLERIVAEGRTPADALVGRPELAAVRPDHFTDDTIYRRTVRFYHQLEAQPLVEAWQRVTARVVSIHGAQDWITAPEDSVRIAGLAPQGEFRSVAAADHQFAWVDPDGPEELGPRTLPNSLELRLAPELRDFVRDVLLSTFGR